MSNSGTRTICPYCGVGCGVVASTLPRPLSVGNSPVAAQYSIKGDTEHPSNLGRLCSKGADLAQTFNAPHRLLQPCIEGKPVNWETATRHIAQRFQQTIDEFGSNSVAFYVSGQLLTEDYYVVNKLTKGWFGTANIDTNSRLCMASSVAGHKRAFGSDTVPGCYDDLEQADLLVLVGSNLAWCHPVLYQRIRAAREKRPHMKLLVIDPRRSATADQADVHLAIRPDADVLLFNALLVHLADAGQLDKSYLQQHVNGFEQCLEVARESIQPATRRKADSLSTRLGISDKQLQSFFALFESYKKTVTVYSQGVNQSVVGTDKVNAIINCHLATGRIGKPGMGPFSITGQPNAMGGREVGGLATMLAAHMELNNASHRSTVQRFWKSPAIADQAGLTAVELFDAVAKGSIKALWVMATNPIDSMPNADHVERAIAHCPFVVVSEVSSATDTVDKAHVALPAQPFGEKNGTVTNSERRISRMRSFTSIQGDAKPDWWAVCEVAKHMGFTDSFNYPSVADVFREHATLSGFENNGARAFDISAYARISNAEYHAMLPFQWPKAAGTNTHPVTVGFAGEKQVVRFFAKGQFYTDDRKANMLPVAPLATQVPENIQHLDHTLNTGRIRDQWHTMTRTGYSSRLMSHYAEPFVELNPQLAKQYSIATGDIVKIASSRGHVLLRASVSDRQQPFDVFVPMHWNAQFSARARIDAVVDNRIDPISRQPAFKNQMVSVSRFAARSFAYVLSPEALDMNHCHGIEYWAKAPVSCGWQLELAGSASPRVMLDTVVSLLPLARETLSAKLRSIEFNDTLSEEHRIAFFFDEQLVAMVFVASSPVMLSRSWAASVLDVADGSVQTRWQLLAGRPTADRPDKGAIICSCMMVGEKEIEAAIYQKPGCTVADVGRCTQAGTQCGSCRNELVQIIKRCAVEKLDAEVA